MSEKNDQVCLITYSFSVHIVLKQDYERIGSPFLKSEVFFESFDSQSFDSGRIPLPPENSNLSRSWHFEYFEFWVLHLVT